MIKHDYKPQNNKELSPKRLNLEMPEWLTHPFLIIGASAFVIIIGFLLVPDSPSPEPLSVIESLDEQTEIPLLEDTSISGSASLTDEKKYSAPIDIQLEIKPQAEPEEEVTIILEDRQWESESVKKGDNLSNIFKRIGLSPQQTYLVANLDDNTQVLKKLKPGQIINYQLTDEKTLSALKYAIDIQNTLYIESKENTLVSRIENKAIEYRTAYAQGTITDSLFAAGKNAGLTDTQVMQMANIFGWDIDFILDIRKGDSFSLLYEEKYLDGDKIGNGGILAAEFINQGKSFVAVRYTDKNNRTSYFTPDGLSMRKAFLRAPLNFAYISSNFKPRRFHPILKRWKAHKGIDYRAKTGTPIRAAGDGKVIASSYSKYNGKYVFIQHGQGIVTKYLHMSRRAVSKNKRVKQGQVIGYVGMTGLAEAPHLHYEFLVNGVHRNPRTVSLPQAKPIAKTEKERFTTVTNPIISQLEARNAVLAAREIVAP